MSVSLRRVSYLYSYKIFRAIGYSVYRPNSIHQCVGVVMRENCLSPSCSAQARCGSRLMSCGHHFGSWDNHEFLCSQRKHSFCMAPDLQKLPARSPQLESLCLSPQLSSDAFPIQALSTIRKPPVQFANFEPASKSLYPQYGICRILHRWTVDLQT